jgi:hypothetical protein
MAHVQIQLPDQTDPNPPSPEPPAAASQEGPTRRHEAPILLAILLFLAVFFILGTDGVLALAASALLTNIFINRFALLNQPEEPAE